MKCCDEKMRHTELGYYVCDICQNKIEDELGIIMRTLEENPGANAIDLARLTNLPNKTIIKYVNDGTLTSIKKKREIKYFYNPREASKPKWHIQLDNLFKN